MATSDPHNLKRFIDAQDGVFDVALAELNGGLKQTHWMWFIFPQLSGLGRSPAAKFFGFESANEARAYLDHPKLGPRLHRCVDALLPWAQRRSADEILGTIDAMKFRSSLTLFDQIEPDALFEQALLNFFNGCRDELTLALLQHQQ